MAGISEIMAIQSMIFADSLLIAAREKIVVSGGWVFVALGLFFACVGILIWVKSLRFIRRGVKTSATVIDFRGRGYPVVEFNDPSGNRQEAQLSCTGGAPVGDPLDIIYDPVDPSDALEDSFFKLWILPLCFFLIGASSVLIGTLALMDIIELSSGP